MKSFRFLILLLSIAISTFAVAEDFWQKKPYEEWSDKECQKLLHDSPWAQTFTTVRFVNRARGRKYDQLERAGESLPELSYVAQIRSALPIRQALARQLQLNSRFVLKPPQEKQNILEESRQYLAEKFVDTISFYISYTSNVPIYDVDMVRFWETQHTETMRNQIYLIRGSDRIELIRYQPAHGQDGFEVTFPRYVRGGPLLSAGDKSLDLSIELLYPAARQPLRPFVFHFKPEKMIFKGELSY